MYTTRYLSGNLGQLRFEIIIIFKIREFIKGMFNLL